MKYYDALDNILDRPIAFNPSFKKITGSTNAALLLSQAFYWTKRTKDTDGWFYKTREEWMEETGLTESELDGARGKCRSTGVMEEKLKGVPATVHYRVVKQKVYELLGVQIPEFPESSFHPNSQFPEKPESDFSGNFNRNTESTAGNTAYFRGDQERPDKISSYLAMANFPGAKKEARIDAILSYLGGAFRRNTSTKEWREFAKYIDSEKQLKGWDVEVFVKWLIGKSDYNPDYWSVKRMMEFYPMAFEKGESSEKGPKPL